MITTRSRATLVAALALGSALALAGCAAATTPTATSAPSQQQTQQRGGGGVSGLIAAASDGLLQVQSTDTQTAVSYTADTTVSAQQSGSLTDVAVGDCVVVMTAQDADTASSVIVTPAVDGECTGGFGGGGTRPTDAPTDAPQSGTAPSGAPTNLANGGFRGFTAGPVTAISGSTITVDARTMGSDDATSTGVTIGSDTTFTVTVASDVSALVVGQCVTAQGKADTSGGFAATALTVSAPSVDGTCGMRFGGGQGGPGAGTSSSGNN